MTKWFWNGRKEVGVRKKTTWIGSKSVYHGILLFYGHI